MKKYINKIIVVCIIIILILSYYTYERISIGAPLKEPYVTIKYNNKAITIEIGEHNWLGKDGGNSYLAGSSYEVGQKCDVLAAKPNDIIKVTFSSKPKEMKVLLWSDYSSNKVYKSFGAEKKYKFVLPEVKGEYIFEVMGYWDDRHNTSDIFRVKIE